MKNRITGFLILITGCIGIAQISGTTSVNTYDTYDYEISILNSVKANCFEPAWEVTNGTIISEDMERVTIQWHRAVSGSLQWKCAGTSYESGVLTVAICSQRLNYEYDDAGNRTARKLITIGTCGATPTSKSVVALVEEIDIFDTLRQELVYENIPEENIVEEVLAEELVNIYPNPTRGQMVVEIANFKEANGEIAVYGMNGENMFSQDINGQYTNIDISNAPAGMYVLRIHRGGEVKEWKVLKY